MMEKMLRPLKNSRSIKLYSFGNPIVRYKKKKKRTHRNRDKEVASTRGSEVEWGGFCAFNCDPRERGNNERRGLVDRTK